jgi:light-regulated signal transduction histidine kinase (bacteriophytochrome)
LESRVAERTEALQQANRELEAFSYSVSHDLRAPLRHIAGFVELLVEESGESLSAEGRRYLGVISDSAARMGLMIDDLLAFSRAGRSEVRKSMIDLRQLVNDAIRQMEQDLVNRRIEWKIGDLPQINADRGLMSLVLSNLIGNAVKYSRARDPAVIEIGADEHAGSDEVVVFVRDNGIGFDMKYAHKLFGVFQRLHNDTEYEGTGIGLANVRRIIERHGGRVWAEAIENRGSTFYFALPVAAERQPVALAA